jgi:cytochrome c peroxidase
MKCVKDFIYALIIVLLSLKTGLAQSATSVEQYLGELLFDDKALSLKRNQACSSCHSLKAVAGRSSAVNLVSGFVDPENIKKKNACFIGFNF